MGRNTNANSPMHRIRAVVAAVAIVSMALVVAGLSNVRGTFALWNNSTSVSMNQSITSGKPALSVSGFSGLSSYTYTEAGGHASAQVTITNTGNVTLRGFTATPTLQAGSPVLFGAVTLSYSPALSTLEIPAQQSRTVTVTTTLSASADLQAMSNAQATTNVVVNATTGATPGASWVVSDGDNAFTQSVAASPSAYHNICFTPYGTQSFGIYWTNPPTVAPGDRFQIHVNGVPLGGTQGTAPANNFSFGTYLIPASIQLPTTVGDTTPLTIKVVDYGSGELIAWGTVTVRLAAIQGSYYDYEFVNLTPVCSASAPAILPMPVVPPLESAPDASVVTPELDAPAQPAPAPDPAPQPEPAPEPAPAPAPAPDTVGEVELGVIEQDGQLQLKWQNPEGIPEGTVFELYVNGQATGELTDTVNPVIELSPARIPAELWTADGDVHEATVTIVPELSGGNGQPIARAPIWVTAAADAAFTLHITDPAA